MSIKSEPLKSLVLIGIILTLSGCYVSISEIEKINSNNYKITAYGNQVTSKSRLIEKIESEARNICKNSAYELYGSGKLLEKDVLDFPKGTNKKVIQKAVCIKNS